MQTLRLLQRLLREVNAADLRSMIVQVASDLSGAASHVTDNAGFAYLFNQPIKHLPIKWLLLQLAAKFFGIIFLHAIITAFQLCFRLLHDCSILTQPARSLS